MSYSLFLGFYTVCEYMYEQILFTIKEIHVMAVLKFLREKKVKVVSRSNGQNHITICHSLDFFLSYTVCAYEQNLSRNKKNMVSI